MSLDLFLGYDSREPIAFWVAAHSFTRRSSIPIAIRPLVQSQLRNLGMYTRQRGTTESTEFSMTRFLVPYLMDYKGWALFADSDVLCLTDIADLWREVERQPGKAVYVVQHDYTPTEGTKMDGQIQTVYARKNWSSVMLFDCSKCTALTPKYVNEATGLQLHRFQWLPDAEIGALPMEWNVLVDEPNQTTRPPKILHYTLGGPWFRDHANGSYSDLWYKEHGDMDSPPLVGQWNRAAWMVDHAEVK